MDLCTIQPHCLQKCYGFKLTVILMVEMYSSPSLDVPNNTIAKRYFCVAHQPILYF